MCALGHSILPDPSGRIPVKIWVAAFIEPPYIRFPYQYVSQGSPFYPSVDFNALWDGNNRQFYSGGSRPSSKVWHEVTFNTDNPYLVMGKQGTSSTTLVYTDTFSGRVIRLSGQESSPARPITSYAKGKLSVSLSADSKNPLVWFAPGINYNYHFAFDLTSGKVSINGSHDWFPWHEVYITIGDAHHKVLQYAPAGVFGTGLFESPWSLGLAQRWQPQVEATLWLQSKRIDCTIRLGIDKLPSSIRPVLPLIN